MRYLSLVLLLAAAFLGWTVFWFQAANLAERETAAWFQARAGEGWTAENAGISVAGYPFRLELTIDRPRLGEGAAWSWTGGRARIVVHPWALDHAVAELDGPQEIAAGDRRARVEAQLLHGSLKRDGQGGFEIAVLEGRDGRAELDGAAYGFARVQLSARVDPQNNQQLDLAVVGEELALPAQYVSPLGAKISRIDVQSEVARGWPAGPFRTALTQWRDDGGAVRLPMIGVLWGPLDLRGDATLTLDAEMRPLGAGTFAARGLDQAVAAFERDGLLKPSEAGFAKAAAGMFSKSGAKIPLTAQEGWLFLGPVKLAPLLPVF